MTPEKIEGKWQKLKGRLDECPDCQSHRIGLNHSLTRRWKPYFLECENCHYCGKDCFTIRGAIWSWNNDTGSYGGLMEV